MQHQGRRYEVEKLVKDEFAVYQEQAVAKRAHEEIRVLNEVAARRNTRGCGLLSIVQERPHKSPHAGGECWIFGGAKGS